MKKLFTGVRKKIRYESIRVFANSYNEAVEMIRNDELEVEVVSESYSDWELDGYLIKQAEEK
jgi:hypothetical protein